MVTDQKLDFYRNVLAGYFDTTKILIGHLNMIVDYFEEHFSPGALKKFEYAIRRYVSDPAPDYARYRRVPELRHLKGYFPVGAGRSVYKCFGVTFPDAEKYQLFQAAYRCCDYDRCSHLLLTYCSNDPFAKQVADKFDKMAKSVDDDGRDRRAKRRKEMDARILAQRNAGIKKQRVWSKTGFPPLRE
ncbi:MAG: hypothetical protein JEZ07_12935 [Phycisphaerae bacterium]|nr:hypothetical protein [Phycisphaerae bacterium]